jgi:hypothetical protein
VPCRAGAGADVVSRITRLQHRPTDLQVDDFYAFWFNFKSWRNFPVEDEEKARTQTKRTGRAARPLLAVSARTF